MIVPLLLPVLDLSRTNLLLPPATEYSNGGFSLSPLHSVECRECPTYSPVDLAVCGLSSMLTSSEAGIHNLSQWFVQNPPSRLSEQYILIGLLHDEKPIFKTVLAWRTEPSYLAVLRKLAPFTFRS